MPATKKQMGRECAIDNQHSLSAPPYTPGEAGRNINTAMRLTGSLRGGVEYPVSLHNILTSHKSLYMFCLSSTFTRNLFTLLPFMKKILACHILHTQCITSSFHNSEISLHTVSNNFSMITYIHTTYVCDYSAQR